MAKPSNLQLRAILLTLLLAGGECARVESGVEQVLEADKLGQDNAAMHDVFFQLGGGSPVCADMADSGAAIQRYEAKLAKLKAISASVLKANCIASCPLKIREIKWRMAEFKSCTSALSKKDSMPAELRSVMTTSTGSLQSSLLKVSTDLVTLMKKNSMFEPKEGCDFQPQGFKPEDATDMDDVRKSIFGNGCGSEEAVNAYIKSLPESERNVLKDFMEKAGKMVQTVRHAKETGEAKEDEVAELEADIDDLGSALLALDSEGALESGNSASFLLALLAIILAFVLFWILVQIVEGPY